MPIEALVKFAEDLKAAREAKKITLQQIANRTKIDQKFLEAIEDGRFDILPNLYIRAFIKEYANAIDFDPEDTILKFDAAQQGRVEEQVPAEKKIVENNESKVFESTEHTAINETIQTEQVSSKFNFNYLVLSIAALVVIILIYFIFFSGSSTKIISQKPFDNSVEKEKPAFEIDTPKTEVKNIPPANDSLQLRVNTTQRVWVKVVSDKNVKYEGMVDANSTLYYNAFSNFRVVVGNAGFVQLALNGKPIEDIGQKGEVRNIIISADTVRAYTLLIPKKNETESQQKN